LVLQAALPMLGSGQFLVLLKGMAKAVQSHDILYRTFREILYILGFE
jgi:hypothetical protein